MSETGDGFRVEWRLHKAWFPVQDRWCQAWGCRPDGSAKWYRLVEAERMTEVELRELLGARAE